MPARILVVDDEPAFLDSMRRGLLLSGFTQVRVESNPLAAASLLEKGEVFDVALLDITMPQMDGVELLTVIKNHSPHTECIMVTAVNEAGYAVASLKKGAFDYVLKPVSLEDLVQTIDRALERKRLLDILEIEKKTSIPELENPGAFAEIITGAPKMVRILREAELHAASNVPILITGESGTGKELLAQAIHRASPRAGKRFTPINMTFPGTALFESEFFGHTKGAFTGADKERQGLLEYTEGGTLFMDEIGNLSPELQGKLLRVLQEGEFFKLGTHKPRKVDVRFVAATNADLESLLAQGLFRKDFYYRLRGAWLHLPPLRERKEDIPRLAKKFLEEFTPGPRDREVDGQTLNLLLAYDYPWNIRELKSILQAAVNLAKGRQLSSHLLPKFFREKISAKELARQSASPEPIMPLAAMEKNYILNVYRQTGRNKSRTALLLGLGLNTLRRKLQSYGEE